MQKDNLLSDLIDKKVSKSYYGKVVAMEAAIARCTMIPGVKIGDALTNEGGHVIGYVYTISEDHVNFVILVHYSQIYVGLAVFSAGRFYLEYDEEEIKGNIINIFGKLVTGSAKDMKPSKPQKAYLDQPVGEIISRRNLDKQMMFGIAAVDIPYPVLFGQRMLVVGEANTCRTTISTNCIFANANQPNVHFIYVGVLMHGKKIAALFDELKERKIENFTIMASDGFDSTGASFLMPQCACAVAEHMVKTTKKDVVVIFDSLTNHAAAHREISLLSQMFPGREAYPADIFNVYAKILEKGGAYAKGGSITMVPIVKLIGEDISQFISTTIISITDGQIVTSKKLSRKGIMPPIDIGLSVSRVGAASQDPLVKKYTKTCTGDMAKYFDLQNYVDLMGKSILNPNNIQLYVKGALWQKFFHQNYRQCYDAYDLAAAGYVIQHLKGVSLDSELNLDERLEKIAALADKMRQIAEINQIVAYVDEQGENFCI